MACKGRQAQRQELAIVRSSGDLPLGITRLGGGIYTILECRMQRVDVCQPVRRWNQRRGFSFSQPESMGSDLKV